MLMNRQANESDRVLAAEFAGEIVVIDDELADSLVTIVGSPDESEQLRSTAAIALGPVLEQTDTDGFDDPDEPPITEGSFRNIQESLQKLYFDDTVPKQVRRRILEASVRAPEKWHENAIRAAYASGDRDWVLTAVFSMRWVRGFDDQILEALKSTDPEIHYEAIEAAGNSELEGAWSHVVNLVQDHRTPKRLLLAAIMAVGSIHPEEAGPILVHLADSDDEEIAEAAHEAMAMAEIPFDEEDEEGEGERMN
jgi:HEAT repeat protein